MDPTRLTFRLDAPVSRSSWGTLTAVPQFAAQGVWLGNAFSLREMHLQRKLPSLIARRDGPQESLGLRKMRNRSAGYRRYQTREPQFGSPARLRGCGLSRQLVRSCDSMRTNCPRGGTASLIQFVYLRSPRPGGSLPFPKQKLWIWPSRPGSEKAATTTVQTSRTSALFGFPLSPLIFSYVLGM